MRLPMKPSQTPDTTPILRIVFASRIAVASTGLARLPAADDLEQAHHVRRAEEMQADHDPGREVRAGDRVDVQRRCVGRENRARLHDPVERREHLLLDLHVLEHRLDHQIGVAMSA